jgi:hypothetical protein
MFDIALAGCRAIKPDGERGDIFATSGNKTCGDCFKRCLEKFQIDRLSEKALSDGCFRDFAHPLARNPSGAGE